MERHRPWWATQQHSTIVVGLASSWGWRRPEGRKGDGGQEAGEMWAAQGKEDQRVFAARIKQSCTNRGLTHCRRACRMR